MDSVTQFKNLLNSSLVSKEEKEKWLDLIPVLKEEELRELISLLKERQEMTSSLTSKIGGLVTDQASRQRSGQKNISIKDILQWNIVQLSDRLTIDKLKILVEKLIEENNVDDGVDLFRVLKELLERNSGFRIENQAMAKEYDLLMAKLSYLSLPALEDDDIDELFKNYLFVGFNLKNIDLKEKMGLRFLLYHDEATDGAERKQILRAIKENIEMIGKEKIQIVGEEKMDPPTVKNWLRDYELSFDQKKIRTTVEAVTYLNQSKNARKLLEEDRKKLLQVLSFYDALLFPTAVGEVRERKVARSASSFPQREGTVLSAGDIEKKYQENLGSEEKVKKVEEEISGAVKSGVKIGDMIYEELFPKTPGATVNKEKIIASLKVAANLKELGSLLNDSRYAALVEKYLSQRNNEQGLNDFKINPAAPNNLIFLLRYILEDILKLTEEKSAGIGIQLVNLMRKNGENKYNTIVYFDESKGGFVWAE